MTPQRVHPRDGDKSNWAALQSQSASVVERPTTRHWDPRHICGERVTRPVQPNVVEQHCGLTSV